MISFKKMYVLYMFCVLIFSWMFSFGKMISNMIKFSVSFLLSLIISLNADDRQDSFELTLLYFLS